MWTSRKTASGVPYVYSIVKIRLEPVGVEYNLTLHFPGEHPVQLRGGFAEGNPTGARMRWSMKWLGATWWGRRPRMIQAAAGRATPFDHSTTGFVMNMSELPRFDEQFLAHPLSMARELLRSIMRQLMKIPSLRACRSSPSRRSAHAAPYGWQIRRRHLRERRSREEHKWRR